MREGNHNINDSALGMPASTLTQYIDRATVVSNPDLPLREREGRRKGGGVGGLVNIVQNFCASTEFLVAQSDWNYLRLPYHKLTHHTFPILLINSQKLSKQLQRLSF